MAAETPTTDEAALKSFEALVARHQRFFATAHYVVDKQMVPWAGPNGAYFVHKYGGSGVAYDVEKTASLVSQYLAHVEIQLTVDLGEERCGTQALAASYGYRGFASVAEANASAGKRPNLPWPGKSKRRR